MIAEMTKTGYTVIQTLDPLDSMNFIPFFTMTYQSREESYLEVRNWMTHEADNTCAVLILDGNIVKGVGLAYGRENDAFIWEAHADPKVPRKVVDEALEVMCQWAKSKGYNKISGQPNRAAKLWVRRWGFKISADGIGIYKEI